MTKHNKFIEDMSKIASSTFATLINIKNEISNLIKENMKASMKGMNLTSKSDFNGLKQSVSHLYEEVKKMSDIPGVDNNRRGDKMATVKKTTTTKKPATKKPAAKKTAVKKPATKKKTVTATKATAKKTTTKKPAAKKTTAKKTAPKKAK